MDLTCDVLKDPTTSRSLMGAPGMTSLACSPVFEWHGHQNNRVAGSLVCDISGNPGCNCVFVDYRDSYDATVTE